MPVRRQCRCGAPVIMGLASAPGAAVRKEGDMKRRFYWLATVVATAALLSACAGDTNDEATSAEDEASAPDTPVATQEAEPTAEDAARDTAVATEEAEPADRDEIISLLEQAFRAHRGVETVRARMDMEMKAAGEPMSMRAEYAFRLPGDLYGKMEIESMSFEMVMTEGRLFMKFAGSQWVEIAFGSVLPFDIESMMSMAATAETDWDLYENLQMHEGEVIDGVETVHVSYEMDMEKGIAQASDILGEDFSELIAQAGGSADVSGRMRMDVWLDEDDKLPRRMESHMDGSLADDDSGMTMTIHYFGHGEPVDIPSLEEMLERTGGWKLDPTSD